MSEEDEIIQQGLKSHTKTDTMCYVGIGLLAIMILIPPVFRIIFKDLRPKVTIEKIVYLDITCRKSYMDNTNNEVTQQITGHYRDNNIHTYKVEFFAKSNKNNLTDSRITTFIDLKNATNKVSMKEEGNVVTFEMDFLNNKEIRDDPAFAPYAKQAPAEITELRNAGFLCLTDSEEKEEDTSKIDY